MRVSKTKSGGKVNGGSKSMATGGDQPSSDDFVAKAVDNPESRKWMAECKKRLAESSPRFEPDPVYPLPNLSMHDMASVELLMHRLQYPSLPSYSHTRKTYSDKTSQGLTKAIVTYFDVCGVKAWRQSSEGRYREGETVIDVVGRTRIMKGTWLPGQNVGHADVSAIIQGRFVAVEVKIGKDRQSDKQKEFERELVKSGGVYIIVKTWEDFINQITTLK